MKLNHPFKPSFIDVKVCERCKQPKEKHGKDAVCDSCTKTGMLQVIDNIAMCPDCVAENIKASLPSVPVHELTASSVQRTALEIAKDIDVSIRISGDVFNARTVAIVELENSIKADDAIPATLKNAKLLEALVERANTHKQAIFAKREKMMELQKEMEADKTEFHAIQQRFNELAKGLQESERAKYKLESLDYKPAAPKTVKPKIASQPKGATLADTARLCAVLGISMATVQALVVGKGLSYAEAVLEVKNAQKKG